MTKSNHGLENIGHRVCVIIIAATAIIYLNTLDNGFVADDGEFVVSNISIRSLKNTPSFFLHTMTLASRVPEWGTHIYRPLRTTSYALDYAIFGLNNTGFHLTNITLHILVCITLYFLLIGLVQKPVVALFGALLFAVHPVHVEAVAWIASRADLIGMLFLNLTLICYLKYRKNQNTKIYLYLSLVLSFLSYLGKESMIVLPGLIILSDIISPQQKSFRNGIKANFLYWISFIAVSVGYLVLRFSVTGRVDQEMQWWGGSIISNFLMTIKAIAIYILLLFFPFQLKTHYIVEPVTSILDVWVILSLLIIGASVAVIMYSFKKERVIFFLLIWFYIGIIPIANIIPLTFSVMAERYIYMPSAGPIAAVVYGIYLLGEKKKIRQTIVYGILSFIVLIFSWRVITQNNIYTNELTFYTSSIESSPKSVPSYKGLADLYLKDKDFSKAIGYYETAIKLDPNYADAFIGQALALNKLKKNKEALDKAKRAISLKPKTADFWYNAGNIYKDLNDFPNAVKHWKRTVELNPNHSGAYNNLGNYYLMTNNAVEALRMYKESLKADPYNAATYYNIAAVYERQGSFAKAREYYLQFIDAAGDKYQQAVESIKRKYRLN